MGAKSRISENTVGGTLGLGSKMYLESTGSRSSVSASSSSDTSSIVTRLALACFPFPFFMMREGASAGFSSWTSSGRARLRGLGDTGSDMRRDRMVSTRGGTDMEVDFPICEDEEDETVFPVSTFFAAAELLETHISCPGAVAGGGGAPNEAFEPRDL